MTKIYVASSWKTELQPHVVSLLRAVGHEVFDFRNPSPGINGFSWSEIDTEWRTWTVEQYTYNLKNNPRVLEAFNLDFGGMNAADVCVLLLPSGRSAHTEAGYMAGQGKKVIVYSTAQEEPGNADLMYKIFHTIVDNDYDLLSALRHVDGRK